MVVDVEVVMSLYIYICFYIVQYITIQYSLT